MSKRGRWATRYGIYFAAIGSAFGLGSLWRFPYVVEANGGGAFVVLYFFLLILIGLPLLVGELLIGKVTRRGVLAGQKQLFAQVQSRGQNIRRRPLLMLMPYVAFLSIMCCVLILGYYSVITGWVLDFLMQFLGLMMNQSTDAEVLGTLSRLQSSGGRQLALAAGHIMVTVIIVAKGVEEGIERWVGFIMPIFVGILTVLVYRSLSLDSSAQAMQYFLYPDFSRLNFSSLGSVVGHLCFTLSIGFATMATFGSYLGDNHIVPTTGFRVAALDTLAAIIAGLLIFPLIMAGGTTASGPELLFKALPSFFINIEGGKIFGVFFFLCLYLAALGASISILETIVANVTEKFRFKRGLATLIAGALALIVCVVPALSSSYFSVIKIDGRGLLEIFDTVLINWIVPISALIFSQIVVYEVPDKMKRDEFVGFDSTSDAILYNHWRILMKWIVPPIILAALAMQAWDLLN